MVVILGRERHNSSLTMTLSHSIRVSDQVCMFLGLGPQREKLNQSQFSNKICTYSYLETITDYCLPTLL